MARVVVKPSLAGPLARLKKLNAALNWIEKRIPPLPTDFYKNWEKYRTCKEWKATAKERTAAFKVRDGLDSIINEQNAIVRALRSKTGITVGQSEEE